MQTRTLNPPRKRTRTSTETWWYVPTHICPAHSHNHCNLHLQTPEIDSQIVKVIEQIKLKDPSVYDAEHKFFNDSLPPDQDAPAAEAEEAKKPMFLKDFHRERILAGGGEEEEEDDSAAVTTHVQEQENLKQQFKLAVDAADNDDDDENDDDNGEFFKHRVKDPATLEAEERDYRQFLMDSMASVWRLATTLLITIIIITFIYYNLLYNHTIISSTLIISSSLITPSSPLLPTGPQD